VFVHQVKSRGYMPFLLNYHSLSGVSVLCVIFFIFVFFGNMCIYFFDVLLVIIC